MKTFKIIFTLMGSIFLIIALGMYLYFENIKKTSIKTTGKVISAKETPTIEFYDLKGNKIIYKPSFSCRPPCYKLNEKVIVYYKKDNPKDATIGNNTIFSVFMIIALIQGIIFFSIGIGFIYYEVKQKRKYERLKKFGISLETEIFKIENNPYVKVNGKTPYHIITKWSYEDKIYYFKSPNLFINPKIIMKDIKTITVYVNSKNYDEYAMDLSFINSNH